VGEMQRVSVQRPAQRHTSLSAAREPSTVQRARVERHDTDGATLQRMMAAGALQPRLTVGAADDLYEREAERTAAAVMSPGSAMKVGADGFHRTGIAAGLTRVVRRALGRMDPPTSKDDEKRKDEDKRTAVQKKRAGPDPSVVPAGVESSIEAMSASGGSPLPSSLRSNLEVRFGYDFAGVRVHTDPKAAGAASSLGARAFTVGEHVFFGAGEYQPTSRQGLHLIAHELTHVVQQGADPGRIRRRTIESWTLGDTTYFKTRSGEVIELPEDMTAEQVAKLEDDALLAEKKLAELPRPKPVPEVRKPAPKPVKTQAPKPRPRARPAGGKVLPKLADAAAALMKAVGGGAVAKYLVTRGAPVFAQGAAKLSRLRSNEQTHEDSGEKLKRSEDAVKIPASEEQSTGNAAQVGTVGDRPVPVVDDNKGKGKLTQSLDENVPHSIGELDNFKRDKKAQHTGADVMEVVQGDRDAVVKTFGTLTVTPPPVRSTHEPVDLPPPEHAPSTATMNLGRDAIAPLQKEHTDVSAYTKQADSKLKEEGVTQEQLDMVDSGDLAEANKEKKGMAVQAATEPLAIQKMAQEERTKVDKELAHEEHAERGALVALRKSTLAATGSKQKDTRTALEKKREAVATEINSRYQATQDKVTKRLADLDAQSMKRFDDGNAAAAKDFEDDVNRELEAYKDDRYSGWFGWARKAKDWLLGMDKLPRVKVIFDSNRKVFEKRIGKLVEDITADNERVIRECKEELATTRKQIDEFVAGLEPELKEIGKKAAGEMQERLNDLDKQIGKKEEELRNKLKDKQTAAIRAIDEKIEKMKESMSGALAKLGRLLLWAAKKFFTWALEKFGFSLSTIENIINKGTAVLKAIFTGPIQFVKNLISAAKTGFTNFAKNFLTHLKDAVFEWLTGALQGVTLPESWNLKGILSVLFQVIGLTWTNIKARLVLLIPAPVVESLQTTFGLVKTLISDGPMAAWEQLKDVGEDLRKGFVDAITGWIKWKVVEEAVKTVLALFVPGAGIVRAVIAIYDTIVFFIQKAKDIMEMIGNFLGSIAEIAAGNIGAAALALENGLARGLKLVISFLAKFLRLDGITARIRTALDTVRDKVNVVIDKVAAWVVNMAKKAGKIGKTADAKRPTPADTDVGPLPQQIPDAEVKKPTTMAGERHTVTIRVKGGQAEILMASGLPAALSRLAQDALAEVNDPKQTPQFSDDERRGYRVLLLGLRDEAKVENLNSAYTLAGKPPGADQWLSKYITDLIEQYLVPLGKKGFKSIDSFVRSAPDVRFLPVEYQDGEWVRDNLYVSSTEWKSIKSRDDPGERRRIADRVETANKTKSTTIWDELQLAPDGIRGYLIPASASLGKYTRMDVLTQSMARDHVLPLAKHWSDNGYNQTDAERKPVGTGAGGYKLELITTEYNSRKQALGSRYRWDVHGAFASADADSPVKSWKIKGRPYLRTVTGPAVTEQTGS
jgi:uncharacterized protein DUF4157